MEPTPWYRSPVFLSSLTAFITALIPLLAVTAPRIASWIQQITVPTLTEVIVTGLGLISTAAAGVAAYKRATSTVAPLTLTKAKAPPADPPPTQPETKQ
jgi:hypothetical protein